MSAPTAVQAADFDRWAIRARGVPEAALMENAGRQTALILHHLLPRGRVVALVGPGNNGGDALVCLRALAAWGRPVAAVTAGRRPEVEPVLHGWEPPTVRLTGGEGASSWQREVRGAAVIVDGLLGTGIRGAPRPPFDDLIAAANEAPGAVVALDAPSGVDGTTGAVPGAAIQAELTVAYGWPKLGALLHPGRARCGRLVAVEIGFPPTRAAGPDAGAWARLATPAWAAPRLPRRPPDAHKNQVGALALVAGSAMSGAAVLAARSAFRCGAGVVRVCASRGRSELVAGVPEAIFVDAGDEAALRAAVQASDAVAAGPGLGVGPASLRQLEIALDAREDRPGVLDADALTLLARHALRPGPRVALTPHPGEMAVLTGATVRDVQSDRIGAATALARDRSVVALLKGAPSLVADPEGGLLVSTTEHASALAVAGMGDVLTGAAGAFMAQGAGPRTACGLALSVTGRAAAAAGAGAALMPSDVTEAIAGVLADPAPPVTRLPFPFVTFDQPAPR